MELQAKKKGGKAKIPLPSFVCRPWSPAGIIWNLGGEGDRIVDEGWAETRRQKFSPRGEGRFSGESRVLLCCPAAKNRICTYFAL